MDNKWEELKKVLLDVSTPILFLGAGFSLGAKNEIGIELPKGSILAEELYDRFIAGNNHISDEHKMQCKSMPLRDLCGIIDSINGDDIKRNDYLRCRFIGAYSETDYHRKITSYPWKSIYTVNIDDLVENIYESENMELTVYNSKIVTFNNDTRSTELFKLHGCVRNPKEGFIFSEKEYLDITSDNHIDGKLIRFIQALSEKNIIFVGASIDEPDIIHYLRLYDGARTVNSSNHVFFINPNPDIKTATIIEELGGILIKGTTQDFLNFVDKIHYKPTQNQKAVTWLNYNGIFRLHQIEEGYKDVYDSGLFEGNNSEWQDVKEDWVVQGDNYIDAICSLNQMIEDNKPVECFSVYGNMYDGKSCLVKQIGYYLSSKGYEVLEFHGREFYHESIIEYMKSSYYDKYALIVDSGSYYYDRFEKLFSLGIKDKKLIIISGARKYYHKRKRYYLEGNDYKEYEMKEVFSRNDAERIRKVLEKKSRLGFLIDSEIEKQIRLIYKQKNYTNLIIYLSYGNVGKRIRTTFNNAIQHLGPLEQRLLIELVIFDLTEIEVYPRTLFAMRYGRQITLEDKDVNKNNQADRIIDFVRIGKDGIALKNMYLDEVIQKGYFSQIGKLLEELLKYIARFVNEKQHDEWYCIFQRLLKVDILRDRLKMKNEEIDKLISSLKKNYESISYYWLQLGLVKQKEHDYVKAYSYLSKSANIRPHSYQIQHAIARNFLKQANDTADISKALLLFGEGEKRMKVLIESEEYSLKKAKPFSINCYVVEKIRFAEKNNLLIEDNDLKYMIGILGDMTGQLDQYMKTATVKVIHYLKKVDKLDLLRLELNNPYLKYISGEDELPILDEEDTLVETFV